MFRFLTAAILISVCLADAGFSQTSHNERRAQILERQNSYRSQIRNLENQINTYKERLDVTSDEYSQVFRQYEELSRVIALQQERLRQMNQEQRQINEEINLVENNLVELEKQLKDLIDQYKGTLTYLYKHGRTTELALVLTSTSINQLMVRSYYLSKFDQYRQQQMNEIEETQARLEQNRNDLNRARDRNREALASIRTEASELESQRERQNRLVSELQNDMQNFERQISERQNEYDELNRALENLDRELRRVMEAGEEGSPIVLESGISDDELRAFETSFNEKRGQLPWPVENGTITRRFGVRVHPGSSTRTNIPGVDIAASAGSTVRVVNDGYVYGVQHFQAFGETVLVHHGKYLTAYGNLSDIFVRRNQVLRQGDAIGLSGDENSILGEVLFFLIREGSQNVNPENWLQRPVP